MANTYVPIAKNVFTTSAASITFTSIPATFTDLLVLISARTTGSGGAFVGTLKVEYNAATTNNSYRELNSNGTTISAVGGTTAQFIIRVPADGCLASVFGNSELLIPNYAGSTYKQGSSFSMIENNSSTAGESRVSVSAGLWSDTAAINEIKLTANTGSIDTGSSFYLYGIKKS